VKLPFVRRFYGDLVGIVPYQPETASRTLPCAPFLLTRNGYHLSRPKVLEVHVARMDASRVDAAYVETLAVTYHDVTEIHVEDAPAAKR
jgi:hypothetical protein